MNPLKPELYFHRVMPQCISLHLRASHDIYIKLLSDDNFKVISCFRLSLYMIDFFTENKLHKSSE